jgi:serine phosphatase RsbU (regulator of sigma subunit)/CBS domain-containing protein
MDLTPVLTVRELMVADPLVVAPEQTVLEVVRLMNQRRVGAVPVREGDRLVGIFSERDLLRHAGEAPPGWRQRPVADWMTPDPWTIGPDATWQQALSLMETLHIRHVPVVEDGRLIGLVTARDLSAWYSEHLNRTVEERTRELREANERLQERDAELRLHMAVAGRLQARLLPNGSPALPEIDCATHYEPLDALGGDYYNYAQPDGRHLGLLIADASGHSIPAAMVAIMAHTAFTAATRTMIGPAAVLAAMNRHLHGLTGEHFVTAFYAVFDRTTRRLTYANAGHPFPYRCAGPTGRCEPLVARGLMLGVMKDTQYEEHTLPLEPGDRLLFYTDGLLEALGEDSRPFGSARVEACLRENSRESAPILARRMAECVSAYRGSQPARDDLTVLVAAVR